MSADPSATRISRRQSLRGVRDLGGDAELRRRIGELVGQLMREFIGAVLDGSPAEIGELLAALETRRSRPAEARASFPSRAPDVRPRRRGRSPARASDERRAARDRGYDRRPSVIANSPFDITSPGDLLASTVAVRTSASTAAATAGAGAASTAVIADGASGEDTDALPPSPVTISQRQDHHLLDAPSPLPRRRRDAPPLHPESDLEAESERRPRIVLREGERLLSATGSGVVIRRARLNTAR